MKPIAVEWIEKADSDPLLNQLRCGDQISRNYCGMEDAEKCWQIVLRLRELVRSEMKIEAKSGDPEEE